MILHKRRIVKGAHEAAFAREKIIETLVIDIEAKGAGCGIEVGTIDEKRDALFRIELHCLGDLQL